MNNYSRDIMGMLDFKIFILLIYSMKEKHRESN